jgi:predicted acetyltransferase
VSLGYTEARAGNGKGPEGQRRGPGELPSGIEVRPLSPDDDLEAEIDLSRRSFGPVSAASRLDRLASVERSIRDGELVGAFDGARLIGSARYHPMRQWWRGRSMPMAGVAGVKVAPEERGRGVGRALMMSLIPEMGRRGYPLSTLFPATVPLYRSLGWEFAGGKYETTMPTSALATLIGPDEAATQAGAGAPAVASSEAVPGLRRTGPADSAAVVETLGRVYAALGHCGPATHDPELVAGWLEDADSFGYLADDGFLYYGWDDGHDTVQVDLLVAASAQTARAFWRILSSHGSMADTVRACLAPDDPVSWLTREEAAATRPEEGWMLRCLDAPAAVAARGFPAATAVSVRLELSDEVVPANSGTWDLEISGGNGQLTSAANSRAPSLRLGPRGFAALYGGVPLSTLRSAGLASGGSAACDDALDSAFGSRPAFMLHGF